VSSVRVYGQAPGPGQQGRPGVPFSGSSRLADLAGVTPEELAARGWLFRNLIDYWPGPSDGGGDLFPLVEARAVAASARHTWEPGDRILLMGRQVANAFGLSHDYFEWFWVSGGVKVAVFPHPSGRNRFWNTREQTEQARTFLREFVEAHP
jgi:hypothetical protein